jgi:hypothetical protein
MSSGIYSTKNPELGELGNVNNENVSNNDLIQYNTVSNNWENKSDLTIDEIDCRVLRVSETADIVGRLANQGVASFVNDEFIFQNGISNLGDTVYIDNVNNRVGINISNPEEELEVDGSIQIDSRNVSRLKFQQSGPDPHAEAEIDGEEDGTNGGQLEFFTKVDGGSITKKMSINNAGAIGLGDTPNYGTSGSLLTSNGSGALPSWNEPYYFGASLAATQNVLSDVEVDIDFEPYLASPYDGNNGDMTSGLWTCPKDGLYRVSLNVIVSAAGDDVRSSDIWIYRNSDREAGAKYFNNLNDDIIVGTLNCETLVALSAGNTIKGAGRIVLSSGSGRTFQQNATFGGRGTALYITRII